MLLRTALLLASLAWTTVSGQFTLDIMHVNDHHSHIAEEDFDIDAADLTAAGVVLPGDVEEVTVIYGGFPRLVTYMRDAEASSTADGVLKLHAGDAVTGTLYYALFQGQADAQMMNFVCFDAMTLGNHEFDDGDTVLAEFIGFLQDVTGTDCAQPTAVLSANLDPALESPLSGLVAPFEIFDYDGEQVAVISLTTEITKITSSPDMGTTFSEEVAAAELAVTQVTELGVNKIVLVTHVGYDRDFDLANIDGVDVVVGGHSHSLLGDAAQVFPLGGEDGPYPTPQTRATDNGLVCIVQAWEYGHGVGMLSVEFDADGGVVSCTGNPVFPFDNANYDPPLDTETAAAVTAFLEGLEIFVAADGDPDTEAVLAPLTQAVLEFGNETIADVPEPGICYERIPGQGRSEICTEEETSSQGGGACNLVAQAFLDKAPSADIAIQNGGGCRTDIFPGPFQVVEAKAMLPFSNTMVTLEMTGEQIVLVLNQAVNASAVWGISSGAYPYAAGIRFDVDITQSYPDFLSNVEVNIRLEGMWEPIDLAASYTVLTNSFIASGRDNYLEFGEIPEEDVTDLFLEYSQVFIEYAQEVGTLVDPPLETYSTQSYFTGETAMPTMSPVMDMPEPTMSPVMGDTPKPTLPIKDTPEPTMSPVMGGTPEPTSGAISKSLAGVASALAALWLM